MTIFSRSKILILIFLSAFLVNFVLSQEAPPPGEHVFNLEYKPSGFGLDVSVDFWEQDIRFEKEPDFGERSVVRGLLRVGTEKKDHIGFAWDKAEGKLYLDLNRNRDLTDEPESIFKADNSRTYQHFRKIPVKLQIASSILPYSININFHLYNPNRPYGHISIVSGFQAEIELNGKNWLLKVADNMDGKITQSDRIVLIPVEANIGSAYKQLSSPVPETVFFDGHNYRVSFELQPGETAPSLRVSFVEADSPMGRLELEGKFVKWLVLEAGSSLVLLDSPAATVSVPTGNYRWRNIFLDGGEAGLFKVDTHARRADEISVREGESVTLKIGGPLHNSVEIQRMGKVLTFEYKLLGVDGYSYESLRGRSASAPTFAVYKNDKEIASGEFEYG